MGQDTFKRNKYSDRLRLTAADLEAQQVYDRGKRLLLNRALYGRGVIYGFEAGYNAQRNQISISPGLALDAQGREVFATQIVLLPALSVFVEAPVTEENWYLCIRYQERTCGEGHVLLPDGTLSTVNNRIEEGYQVLAVQHPDENEICIAHLILCLGKGHQADILSVEPMENNLTGGLVRTSATTSTGIIRMHCETYLHSSNLFYSEEISHGLGVGNVQITLAVEGCEQGRRWVVTGASDLFYAGFRTAAQLFPETGTFIAAVQVDNVSTDVFEIRWYAQRTCSSMGDRDEWYRT